MTKLFTTTSLPGKMLVLSTLLYSLLLLIPLQPAHGDAWNPVRHPDEESFWRAKTHERTMSVKEMNDKIDVMRKRRGFVPWDESNPVVKSLLANSTGKSTNKSHRT
jgi:hypothetical protein